MYVHSNILAPFAYLEERPHEIDQHHEVVGLVVHDPAGLTASPEQHRRIGDHDYPQHDDQDRLYLGRSARLRQEAAGEQVDEYELAGADGADVAQGEVPNSSAMEGTCFRITNILDCRMGLMIAL